MLAFSFSRTGAVLPFPFLETERERYTLRDEYSSEHAIQAAELIRTCGWLGMSFSPVDAIPE
jgi:hypothetical protein